jgi:membrane-associated phospholipid phosphatase
MRIEQPWTRLWRTIVEHRWQLLLLFVLVLLPLYGFGELAEEVVQQEAFGWDDPILLFVHNLGSPALDAFMLFMSRVGYQWGVLPLDVAVFVYFVIRRRRYDALFFGLAVGGAALLNVGAKLLFGRARPELWLSIAPEYDFSFPSGHAMGSMALAAALVVLLWATRWRYVAFVVGAVFVLLIGLSRIYLGVHYPSDILAGWAAAFAWVMGISSVLYKRLGKPTPQAE